MEGHMTGFVVEAIRSVFVPRHSSTERHRASSNKRYVPSIPTLVE